MKTWFVQLFEKVKDNPAARAVAIVGAFVWGGGVTLSGFDVPIEPWGTIAQGLGAAIGAVAMGMVMFAKPKEPKP